MKTSHYLVAVPLLVLYAFFLSKLASYPQLGPLLLVFLAPILLIIINLPAAIALVRWLGLEHGSATLLAMGVYSALFAAFLAHGLLPLGHFLYLAKAGHKLWGGVPWALPFVATPLILAAVCLARHLTHALTLDRYLRVLATGLLTAVMATALAPAAVSLQFLSFRPSGSFHGVPPVHFAAAFIAGALGSLLFDLLTPKQRKLPPVEIMNGAFMALVFWTSVCLWSRLWPSAAAGIVAMAALGPYLFAGRGLRR